VLDVWFPGAGIEYYYYDELGSFRSDQPVDPSLWEVARFVDEVEQVRQALGLDSDNFVLFGQSWGGILAMEYALHHQEHLKGLVISSMMSSARLYNDYAADVLMPAMDQDVLAEIKRFEADGTTDDPRYEQLLMEHHYVLHVCRISLDQWPDPSPGRWPMSTRRSMCPCRTQRAGAQRNPRGGTARGTSGPSRCRRSSSAPPTTR
jgi:proline iminopeptidase